MHILILIFLSMIGLFLFNRKKPNIASVQIAIIIFFVLFVVEFIAYGYLVHLAYRGGNFALIGNRAILDKIMKIRLIEHAYLARRNKFNIYQIDNKLGYTLGENKYMAKYKATNTQGMRADKDYTLIPADNVLRIAVFGDSYVFCDGESTQNTWSYFLARSIKKLEVLNFGVSGYGLGQSYLRYLEEGLKFNPDIILFNSALLSDRDSFSAGAITKGRGLLNSDIYRVRFWLDGDFLGSESMTPLDLFSESFRKNFIYKPLGISEKLGSPVWKIASFSNVGLLIKQSILKKTYLNSVPKKEKYDAEINLKLLENLLMTAKKNKTTVIFFCDGKFAAFPAKIQQLLRAHRKRVVFINSENLMKSRYSFHGVEHKDLLNSTNHFNARGNQIYAEVIAGILIRQTWGEGDRIFQFDPKRGAFINIAKR